MILTFIIVERVNFVFQFIRNQQKNILIQSGPIPTVNKSDTLTLRCSDIERIKFNKIL